MRHLLLLVITLLSVSLSAQDTNPFEAKTRLSLLAGSSAGYIGDVRGIQPETTLRLQFEDLDNMLRFEAGYRMQIVKEDFLLYQQFIAGAALGRKGFDNMTFLAGMRYVHEKRDYDKGDEITTKPIWIGDYESWDRS